VRILDCSSVLCEADFWKLYVSELGPEGADIFGRNLNALEDALRGGPGWPGEGEIVLQNADHLSPINDGRFLATLRKIAADSEFTKLTLA
jgi:hypothetical protein